VDEVTYYGLIIRMFEFLVITFFKEILVVYLEERCHVRHS